MNPLVALKSTQSNDANASDVCSVLNQLKEDMNKKLEDAVNDKFQSAIKSIEEKIETAMNESIMTFIASSTQSLLSRINDVTDRSMAAISNLAKNERAVDMVSFREEQSETRSLPYSEGDKMQLRNLKDLNDFENNIHSLEFTAKYVSSVKVL